MGRVINLNDTTPAAPSGQTNVKWQLGTSSGTDPGSGLPVFPVSGYVATGSGGTLTAPVEIDTGTPTTIGLKVKGATGSSTSATFVQGGAGNPVTLGSSVTLGNTLIVVGFDPFSSVVSCSDNLGNTFNSIYSTSHLNIFAATITVVGSCTVTAHGPFGNAQVAAVHEYSNLATSSILDASALASSGLGSTLAVGPMTITQTDLLVTGILAQAIATAGSGVSGFTLREYNASGIQTADQNEAAGTYTLTWDISGANAGTVYAFIVALRLGSGVPQSADLLEFEDSSGALLSAVNCAGQFVLPSTSGAPGNVPGACAAAFDPATGKLWIYDGSAWKSVTLT